jgi:ATP-dependent DNA ligase
MQPIPYFGERIQGAWIYEPKIDGWRMQIICHEDSRIECWGRRLERKPNWSDKLGYLLAGLQGVLPGTTLIDCELCSSGGRRFIPSLFAKKPKVDPIVYIFDILFCRGKNVTKKTLQQRKKLLSTINFKPPFYIIRGNELTDLQSNHLSEVRKGHEGIVVKKLDSPYLIGRDAPIATQYWRKIK